MTGLFHTPHNQNVRRVSGNRAKETGDTLNAFAERLSQHGDVARAAAQIGKSPAYGRVLLQRIIAGLGREQCR